MAITLRPTSLSAGHVAAAHLSSAHQLRQWRSEKDYSKDLLYKRNNCFTMVMENVMAAVVPLLAILSVISVGINARATQESTHYDAVVVEYAPLGTADVDPPLEVLARNWAEYEKHIARAKDADIIVFPECGLTTMQLPAERPRLRPLLARVPDPAARPVLCDSPPLAAPSATDVLRNASCAARRHGVYVVLNLAEEAPCGAAEPDCPSDGAFIYNTNVALDRNGALVARYRKVHLFVEPGFNRSSGEEPAVFETDFGVRFATFTCFDLLYESPALRTVRELGATDVAYPAAWFSELPFLTATQTQAGWARAVNVTLLAAGLNRPSLSNGGSGVYWGDGGALKAQMPRHSTSAALRVRVPKRSPPQPPAPAPPPPSPPSPAPLFNLTLLPPPLHTSKLDGLNLWQDDMRDWATVLLPPAGGAFNASLCHGALCCRVEALTQAQPPATATAQRYFYRAGVFNGVRNFARQEALGVQVCGVFACLNAESLASCGRAEDGRVAGLHFQHLAVRATGFRRLRALQMPSTLEAESLLPLPAGAVRFRASTDAQTAETPSREGHAHRGGGRGRGCGRAHLLTTRPLNTSLLAFAVYGRAFDRDRPFQDALPSASNAP